MNEQERHDLRMEQIKSVRQEQIDHLKETQNSTMKIINRIMDRKVNE